MLVLSRKLNEKILFPDMQAAVQVLAIKPGLVRLGIEAPSHVAVLREELQQRAAEWAAPEPRAAGAAADAKLKKLIESRLKVTSIGLEVLRRQLQAGQTGDAEDILERIAEDVLLLRERLEGGAGKA